MAACFNAAKEPHSEIAATNASFKKVYESMTEFTTNGYPWFQVAGLGYTPLCRPTRAERSRDQAGRRCGSALFLLARGGTPVNAAICFRAAG
jgi:hypothetical protein